MSRVRYRYRSLGNINYVDDYLKLHKAVNMPVEGARRVNVGTHFKTPYNFCERIDVRIIIHQVIIDAMDNEGQMQSIKYPKYSA
jgi:hypothetical protein